MQPALFLPDLPLPDTAYRPGHSGRPSPEFDAQLPCPRGDDWRACRPYLRGIDLYNHGFPWEAHEVWESIWHTARRDPELARQASLLRGLIQLAAVRVLLRDGRPRGAERVAGRARRNFERLRETQLWGLDAAQLERVAARLAEGETTTTPPLDPR
ncbi:DUF309 domain-containing protein [Engelhardtia mirabilis]|uniref:DUF309 domain-containing protein n=1 Tax=Engelhardtia mirabilis TaxID=2528011 RepID=A0A518BQV8_9BACT|nr:hypothetical protein Pla133_44800 [Planctomycetes bacterium Pla133]QDV03687.1 hypothetical protein Pla86_44780 [Planctomycetes bacterium Pla86]